MRSAQSEIYRLYCGAMYNVSYRILQNREEAEDALQEAFVDAFTGMTKFRGESTFGAWLKRIVVNRSINQLKKKKMIFSDLSADAGQIADDSEVPSETSMPDCTVEDVRMAVKQLPEGFRIVFSLYMFEDWSHKQIAEELGITESTSKSQLNRARKRIAELIMNRRN